MKQTHVPYVTLDTPDGSEALVPVYFLRLRYVPELEVAVSETRHQMEGLIEGEGRIFVELKRWRAHLETLESRVKSSESNRRRVVSLVLEADGSVLRLQENVRQLRDATENIPEARSLVDRLIESSDHLSGLFSALRLAETSGESGFGAVS